MGQPVGAELFHEALRWINLGLMSIVTAKAISLNTVRFRWFTVYLGLHLVMGSLGLWWGWSSPQYCTLYLWARPIVIVLRAAVTWEVFTELYRAYPGLRILASRALVGSVFAACSLAGVAVMATRNKWGCPEVQCVFFVVVESERFANVGLAIFTLLMFFALSRLPLRIPRSTIMHARYWSIRLIGSAIAMVITLNSNDLDYRRACNIGLLVFFISSNIWWLARIRKEEAIKNVDIEPVEIGDLCRELSSFRKVIEITHDRLNKAWLSR